jgi:predicted GNAT family acetyltransferase
MIMTPIVHQPEQQRFIADVDGSLAILDYSLNGESINFTSTYVPFSLRGQGYAEKLVDTGLKWAREQGYNISTSCWYVAKHLST